MAGHVVRMRPIPGEYDAIEWTGGNADEVRTFAARASNPDRYVGFQDDGGAVWHYEGREVLMEAGDHLVLSQAGVMTLCSGTALRDAYEPAL